jgi:aldehyde dehydrogenase (NAD+)
MATAVDSLVPPPASALLPKKLLINGEWVDSLSGKTFDSIAPSTGKVITQIAEGGPEDIDRAVTAARAAFEGPWSKFTPIQREKVMHRFADAVEARWPEMIATDSLDMGFPIGFGSLLGDSYGSPELLRYFAGWPTKIAGETLSNSAEGSFFTYTRREPAGVVGAITAWNGPRISSVQKIAPALATGCTIVLKPSEVACLSIFVLGEIIQELDLPPGVINIVSGLGPVAGAALVEHPDVNRFNFTGSAATGQSLVRAAAGNFKQLTLEMGGKSPDIIFADADLDAAAQTGEMGIFANSGQMCTAGSRVYVERPAYDDFVERLAKLGASLIVGSSLDPKTMIGPVISQRQIDRISGYIESGKSLGAELVTGGERITEGNLADGFFLPPTVFAGVTDDMPIAKEEIFGPVVSVLPFDDLDEVVRRANATSYGLASGVWTRDIRKATQVAHRLDAGVVWINTYNKFDANTPYGGHKMSGWGSENGHNIIDEYLKEKTVWSNYG